MNTITAEFGESEGSCRGLTPLTPTGQTAKCRREGRYLLRSNLCQESPEKLWELYIQLTEIEEAFKNLKGDLSLRPFRHQLEHRIEAHIFIAFQAYCLFVTLRRRQRDLPTGLTPRQAIDKFRTVQMIDVHLPTTDGRTVIMSRYTQPDRDLQLLMHQMKLSFPDQPPPKITALGFDPLGMNCLEPSVTSM